MKSLEEIFNDAQEEARKIHPDRFSKDDLKHTIMCFEIRLAGINAVADYSSKKAYAEGWTSGNNAAGGGLTYEEYQRGCV